MVSITRIAWLLAAWVSHASGQLRPQDTSSDYDGEITYFKWAPGNVSADDWPKLMASPNLVGKWPIPGYNISQPYDEAEAIDGWTLTFTVREKIPSQGTITRNKTDEVFAGGMIRLEPPGKLVSEALQSDGFYKPHPSWTVSIGSFVLNTRSNKAEIEKLHQSKGSCKPAFNEGCIRDIEENVSWEDRDKDWMQHGPGNTDNCRLSLSMMSEITWLRGTEFVSMTSAVWSPDEYEQGVSEVSHKIDMVIVMWGYNVTDNDDKKKEKDPVTKLICLGGLNKTDGAESEDEDGNEGEGNTAVGGRESMLSMLGMLLPMIAVFMLL
ncbi:hypothetical protein NM208_g13749 [Fusarium decemcellulare]|uniref:Uncharacterized protein n=1 Tax=Fusarium decemcellulare TaxID=57161 RepID=A0ACC1RIK5_9HYPO|nr:hypothetical protein NM208_g13749 [Fusarium decemcellulare]